jgi:2-keto-4-pentenoate hydratase/2-oxohepta-3-ene-1,7-dioic acid hydratase in catechol pathway
MKLVRYRVDSQARWGILRNEEVVELVGSVYEHYETGSFVGRCDELHFLAPCEPGKVVALAYNYRDLVGARREEPLIFLKSPSSVIGWQDPIRIPPGVDDVWVEVELAFVVKKIARHVAPEDAGDCILGYTIGNDVTARNVHGRDHHLARSKSLDTFCPIGQVLHTELPSSSLRMRTSINGRVTQDSATSQRILDDRQALSLISQFMTLLPGDLVLTGTPRGAMESVIKGGDSAVLEIEQIGRLENPIVMEPVISRMSTRA